MKGRTVTREIVIRNRLGLHARAAAQFVKTAGRFRAEIVVETRRQKVNGKSIMGLLLLGAAQGTTLTLRAAGEDGGGAEAGVRHASPYVLDAAPQHREAAVDVAPPLDRDPPDASGVAQAVDRGAGRAAARGTAPAHRAPLRRSAPAVAQGRAAAATRAAAGRTGRPPSGADRS